MKKLAFAGLFAIGLIAMSQQTASAWVNHKFSIGLNWHRQSGGNNFLWGAFQNGQPPGPEAYGSSGFSTFGQSAPQYYAPMPQAAPAASYQYSAPQAPYAGSYYSPFHNASYPREPVFYYYYAAPTYYYGW
jgi:hypothetical protein